MREKLKAQELVDKMLYCYQGHSAFYTAKQCAIIAVNELIKEVNIDCANSDCQQQTGYNISYWQQIEREIEDL